MSDYKAALRADLASSLAGVQEVADHLGISRRKVQVLIRKGVLRPLVGIDYHSGRGGFFVSTPVFTLDEARQQYRVGGGGGL